MKLRKKTAAVLAGALVVGGIAAVAAPSAQAFGPTSVTIPGSLFLGNTPAATNATTNNTFTATISLTLSPSGTINAGTNVTATLSAPQGPFTGPVGIGGNGQIVRGTLGLTGAMSGTVSLASGAACNYPAGPIAANTNQGPWSTSGSFTTSGNGAAQARLNQIFFDDQGNLDGSVANVCAGTANNADYYVSDVTQTAGSGLPGIAKTAPANSATIFEPFTVVGPNATIATSTGQNAGVQAIRVTNGGAPTTTTTTLTGSVWGATVGIGGFTVQFCNTSGASCDTVIPAPANTLQTDGSGNLSGGVTITPAQIPSITTGNRTLRLTQGSNVALVPVQILGNATLSISPSSGGPGTAVALTGASFNPLQNVTAFGSILAAPPFTASADPSSAQGAASATGGFTGSYTVNDPATLSIGAFQGIPGAPTASNPSATAAFLVNLDRCVAYNSNLTGGPGCNTKQNVTVSVLQGRLTQRAYTNTTPTTGSIASTATSPIIGTSNVNSSATQVNLGTITVPLAPATIVGNLNDITVSDNRGGTFGWTLSATMTAFTGNPAGTIANGQLTASPTCVAATAANAWDYNAVGQTAIAGFDPSLNAPGVTAGAAAQAFSGTVNLCTKSTAVNTTTQSTGGVYNVGAPLTLVVPAFQLAGQYTATMTITLA